MAFMAVLAAGSLLAQLGGSLIDYKAKKKQAEAQTAYNEWYKEANTKSINAELTTNLKQIQNRYFEELQAAALQNQAAAKGNLEAERLSEVSALENGLSTGSIENLFAGYERNQAMNDFVSAENARMKGYQLDIDKQSLDAKAQSAINQLSAYDPSSITKPNAGSSILGGLGTAMSTFANYQAEMTRDTYFKGLSKGFTSVNPPVGPNLNI